MSKPTKKFALAASEIKTLVTGFGSCIASDRITVDGLSVGFMYREQPDNKFDSGWRFLAGDESQNYSDDPRHLGIYDVNTIANYDPQITPYLDSPAGSAFGRDPDSEKFVAQAFPEIAE